MEHPLVLYAIPENDALLCRLVRSMIATRDPAERIVRAAPADLRGADECALDLEGRIVLYHAPLEDDVLVRLLRFLQRHRSLAPGERAEEAARTADDALVHAVCESELARIRNRRLWRRRADRELKAELNRKFSEEFFPLAAELCAMLDAIQGEKPK